MFRERQRSTHNTQYTINWAYLESAVYIESMKFDWGWKSSHISNTLSFRINITQLLINIMILSKYWFDFPFWPLLIYLIFLCLIQQLFSLQIYYTNDFSLPILLFFIWKTAFSSKYSINFHLLLLFLILFLFIFSFLCDFFIWFSIYLHFLCTERQYNKTYDLMFIHFFNQHYDTFSTLDNFYFPFLHKNHYRKLVWTQYN